MRLSIEKDPVGVFEDFLPGINNARLNEGGRVEYFTSKVSSRSNDNKSRNEQQDKEGDTCGRQKHSSMGRIPTCLDNLRMSGAENRGRIPLREF